MSEHIYVHLKFFIQKIILLRVTIYVYRSVPCMYVHVLKYSCKCQKVPFDHKILLQRSKHATSVSDGNLDSQHILFVAMKLFRKKMQ